MRVIAYANKSVIHINEIAICHQDSTTVKKKEREIHKIMLMFSFLANVI